MGQRWVATFSQGYLSGMFDVRYFLYHERVISGTEMEEIKEVSYPRRRMSKRSISGQWPSLSTLFIDYEK